VDCFILGYTDITAVAEHVGITERAIAGGLGPSVLNFIVNIISGKRGIQRPFSGRDG
jgi:hypothetical protein